MIARMQRLLLACGVLFVMTACSSDGYVVPPPAVDVDAPQAREIKERIGMDDCARGVERGPVEGGLPNITLPCLGGGPRVNLSSLRGPMIINAWAHWCPPCREEMPVLQEFNDKHGDQVPILGLDLNDLQPVKAMELAEEAGVTYPSLADPGGDVFAHEEFAIAQRGMPAFIFLAGDGTIAGVAAGGIDSVSEMERLVSKHLGTPLTP